MLQELTSGRGSKCTATIIALQNHFKIRCCILFLQVVLIRSGLMPFFQSVVIVGLGASGIDIAREISHVAKEVHFAARYSEDRLGKIELYHNAWMHGEVQL